MSTLRSSSLLLSLTCAFCPSRSCARSTFSAVSYRSSLWSLIAMAIAATHSRGYVPWL